MQRVTISSLLFSLTISTSVFGEIKGVPTEAEIGKFEATYRPDANAYYPPISKAKGESGSVVIRLIIDVAGNAENVSLIQSSGHPRLDCAAVEIGGRYRFKPYLVNALPERFSTHMKISFNAADENKLATHDPKKASPRLFKGANMKINNNDWATAVVKAMKPETPAINLAAVDFEKLSLISQPNTNSHYPALSRRNGEQGKIITMISINENGEVEGASLCPPGPHYNLNHAAIRIAKELQFEPYLINGVPARIESLYTINFTLNE